MNNLITNRQKTFTKVDIYLITHSTFPENFKVLCKDKKLRFKDQILISRHQNIIIYRIESQQYISILDNSTLASD